MKKKLLQLSKIVYGYKKYIVFKVFGKYSLKLKDFFRNIYIVRKLIQFFVKIKNFSFLKKKNEKNCNNKQLVIIKDIQRFEKIHYQYIMLYSSLWFIFIIFFIYMFQSEILLYFFPDIVMSNLDLYFKHEAPFSFNNQVFFVLDDHIQAQKYIKDYGYYFSKFDVNGSILNNYNLFYVTYNTYKRKAQYVGFDVYAQSNDTVKYEYDKESMLYNDDMLEDTDGNYSLEDELIQKGITYTNLRLYLNYLRQQSEDVGDELMSQATSHWQPWGEKYSLIGTGGRSEVSTLLSTDVISDNNVFDDSYEKMYIYLSKIKGSYIGSNYKSFFSWLYDKYVQSIYSNILYDRLLTEIKKGKKKKFFEIF